MPRLAKNKESSQKSEEHYNALEPAFSLVESIKVIAVTSVQSVKGSQQLLLI